jgi:hypothetical protein
MNIVELLWHHLRDRRSVRIVCFLLGLTGLVYLGVEIGVGLVGWAAVCFIVGVLYFVVAFYACVGCVVAAFVCIVPWAATHDASFGPERFAQAAFDAAVWLACSYIDLMWNALRSSVHPQMTPAVAMGLAMVATAGASPSTP